MAHAYLNIVLDTTATPPTVVGVRCMSENAQHATQGPKRSLATIISFEGDSYHEASERMEKFVKADQFRLFYPWLAAIIETQNGVI